MALLLPLASGSRLIVDYLPIRVLRIGFLRDCVLGAVVASMRAHPRQLVDILAIQIHFSTTCPFLIPPPPLVLILNPGIHHRREEITPMVTNPPVVPCKRRLPFGLQAPLNPVYLAMRQPPTLATIPPSSHRHWDSVHPRVTPAVLTSLVMPFMYPASQTFRLHHHLNPQSMLKPRRGLRKPLNVIPRMIFLLQDLMGLHVQSPIVSFSYFFPGIFRNKTTVLCLQCPAASSRCDPPALSRLQVHA